MSIAELTTDEKTDALLEALPYICEFVGKTIGVQRGSGANFHLAWFLERNKVPMDKVTVKFMAAPDQIAAKAS